MNNLQILVNGAGIAGLTVAHWLARAGARVTVVERSPALRAAGQGIDITGIGREVLRKLEIEEIVKANTTKEDGTRIVDTLNRTAAHFPIEPNAGDHTFSPTNELEISRGRLVDVLYDKTKIQPNITHIFDNYITSLVQDAQTRKVKVDFATSNSVADDILTEYDLVVAADGQSSRTRRLAWGEEASRASIVPLHMTCAFFTIPWTEADGSTSRICFLPGRRWFWLRPLGGSESKRTSAYVSISTTFNPAFEALIAAAKTPAQQKAVLKKEFQGVGWESERILEGMEECDDFYLQDVGQIKLDEWSRGSVVAVGDAAYCPSVLSGGGTTTAFIGAYILAGEICKSPNDLQAACKNYETLFRPYITEGQKLIPGVPWLLTPSTRLGVVIYRRLFGLIAWGITTRLAKWLMSGEEKPDEGGLKLADYPEMMTKGATGLDSDMELALTFMNRLA